MEYLVDRVKELVGGRIEQQGFDLVDVKLQRESGRLFLRFFIDRPEGGITLDECAQLNTEIGIIFDETPMIQESFVLEVSSPGIDRLLVTPKDFKRALQREIVVFLAEPVEGRLEYQGKVMAVTQSEVVIAFKGRDVVVPLGIINKARQIINPFERPRLKSRGCFRDDT